MPDSLCLGDLQGLTGQLCDFYLPLLTLLLFLNMLLLFLPNACGLTIVSGYKTPR